MSQAHTLPCGHVYDVVPSWGCSKCAAGLPPDPKPVAATIQNRASNEGEKSEVSEISGILPGGCLQPIGMTKCRECSSPVKPGTSLCEECWAATIKLWDAIADHVRLAEEKTEAPDDSHYARLDPQPIAVIMAWGLTFTLGNVVKYIARAGKKAGSPALVDLKKARRYIDYEIERLEGGE